VSRLRDVRAATAAVTGINQNSSIFGQKVLNAAAATHGGVLPKFAYCLNAAQGCYFFVFKFTVSMVYM
jgi:hypothetical protein